MVNPIESSATFDKIKNVSFLSYLQIRNWENMRHIWLSRSISIDSFRPIQIFGKFPWTVTNGTFVFSFSKNNNYSRIFSFVTLNNFTTLEAKCEKHWNFLALPVKSEKILPFEKFRGTILSYSNSNHFYLLIMKPHSSKINWNI